MNAADALSWEEALNMLSNLGVFIDNLGSINFEVPYQNIPALNLKRQHWQARRIIELLCRKQEKETKSLS